MLWTNGWGGGSKRAATSAGGAVFGAWPAVMLMSLHTISSCCRQWQAAQSAQAGFRSASGTGSGSGAVAAVPGLGSVSAFSVCARFLPVWG